MYVTSVAIVLFLSTIIYSILTSNNSLTSFVTYIPFIAGFLYAISFVQGLEIVKLINEGVILMNKKKFPEALNKIDGALELDPKNYSARYNRANILYCMERHEEVLDEVDKILERNNRDLLTLIIRSQSLLKLEKIDEALEIVEKVLKTSPKNRGTMVVALETKGEILFEMENYPESIKCYDEALMNIPSKKSLFRRGLNFGYICYLDNQIAELWFNKGKAHQKLQQYNEALECFEKALELDPDSEDAKNAKEEVLAKL